MRELSGKVAVVTGGASGIGRAMAAQFVADGMHVVIADVEVAALEGTASELGVVAVPTDVADQASVQALADHVFDRYGTAHVLCNNAGVGGGGQIADLTLADWKWVIDVNLWGVIHGLHSFLPRLLANPDGGHIVNTASMAGLVASAGIGPYSAAKFAVVAISEVLSKELQAAGSAVGVSVLCPGFVRTNIFDSQRNRPEALRNPTKAVGDARTRNDVLKSFLETAMEPAEVARHVRDAIVDDRFWITTHPEFFTAVTRRADDIVAGRNPMPGTFESQSD